jgi:glucose/arabinose dehydrogenase
MAGAALGVGVETSTRVPITTSEGTTLVLERITDGLQNPSDIAFNPDGTIYVAERSGIMRAVRNGTLLREAALDVSGEVVMPHGGLLAIALDPKFSDTGLMYALYAAGAPRGGLEFMLARFRGVGDRFAERAMLLDRVAASPDGASGALRVGADGKLYVALDNAADQLIAGNFGSYNGKVLRLNTDATTPDDHTDFTPIYSPDHPQPKALDWQPVSGTLWVIDGVAPSGGRLSAVEAQNAQQRRAAFRTAYTLPQGTGASSATFYRGELISIFRGNLFVAAETGRQLMRMQFDSGMPSRITSVEYFLKDEIGPMRVVAEGRDGALYVASDTSLYRLAP